MGVAGGSIGGSTGTRDGQAAQPDELGALLAALGAPVRLKTLQVLAAEGEKSVAALTARLGVRQPTVSHHLSLLRLHRLVNARRAGRNIYYSTARGVACDDGALVIRAGGFSIRVAPTPAGADARERAAAADGLRVAGAPRAARPAGAGPPAGETAEAGLRGLVRPFVPLRGRTHAGMMPAMSPAVRAVENLRRARRRIVETAADWQARGIDTEPLNAPLIGIQEALAELEALDVPKVAAAAVYALGQDLRNEFNAVRVSGAGLETEDVPANRVRWLELMERAAERCIRTLDRMEPLLPDD